MEFCFLRQRWDLKIEGEISCKLTLLPCDWRHGGYFGQTTFLGLFKVEGFVDKDYYVIRSETPHNPLECG